MSDSLVTSRTEDHLHFVTINRPEKRNALTLEMVELLAAGIREADESA